MAGRWEQSGRAVQLDSGAGIQIRRTMDLKIPPTTPQACVQAPEGIHPSTDFWATGSPSSAPRMREMVAGRWNRSSASGSSRNFLTTLLLSERIGVRIRTFGLILRTTSSFIASATFDRIDAMQMLSSPLVVGKRNAEVKDETRKLVGVHGSMRAKVSNVFFPVSSITNAVGRTLTLWRWRSAASDGGESVWRVGGSCRRERCG